MRPGRPLLVAALAVAAALGTAARAPAEAGVPPQAVAAGEDSPWPDTTAVEPNVRAVSRVVADLEAKVELMELSARRYADWQACLRGVPVSEYGDPDGRAGYVYDERDGTESGFMPALAVDRSSRPRAEDYLFLDFARTGACRSDATLPGGTADAASVSRGPVASAAAATPSATTIGDLERRVRSIKRSTRQLLASSEQFDAWESCVSWVPVTEYGDAGGMFGFRFGDRPTAPFAYRSALAVDRSDWDDPDYMFLALVGGDRPGRSCQDEPGEAVD